MSEKQLNFQQNMNNIGRSRHAHSCTSRGGIARDWADTFGKGLSCALASTSSSSLQQPSRQGSGAADVLGPGALGASSAQHAAVHDPPPP